MQGILRVAGQTGRTRYAISTIDTDSNVVREIPEGESYFDTLESVNALFLADGFVDTASPDSAPRWEHPEDIRVSRRLTEMGFTVADYIEYIGYIRQYAAEHGGEFDNNPQSWLATRGQN